MIYKFMKKFFQLLLIFVLGLSSVNAQTKLSLNPKNEQSLAKKSEIKVAAKFQNNKVYLKWAPNNFDALMHGLKHGFNIYRTISNTKIPYEKISNKPIIPITLAEIKQKNDTTNATRIVELALTTNVIQEPIPANLGLADRKIKTQDLNYAIIVAGMAMYNQTAQGLGLYFEDISAESGKEYIYKIECVKDFNNRKLEGTTYVNTGKEYLLPTIDDAQVIFTQRNVTLGWKRDYIYFQYSYFDIFRSENENSGFVKLNERPFVSAYSETDIVKNYSFYADSVPEFDKKYFYKIVGIGPFGDISLPVIVSGIAQKALNVKPILAKPVAKSHTQIQIKWEFDSKDLKQIKEVNLERGKDIEGPFEVIRKLSTSENEFVDNNPITNGYYRLKLLGKSGDSTFSKIQFYHIVDSIAPSVPMGLKGYIDTNFVAHISWNKNVEKDIYGYRVFRAQHKNDFMYRITPGSVADTVFHDTIQAKNSTLKTIYYTIAALDEIGNVSKLTLPLELKRPDKIKPQSPEILRYQLMTNAVFLKFIPSSSFDLKKQEILRKGPLDLDFKIIKTFISPDSMTFFIDTTVQNGYDYQYTMNATDETGLVSLPSRVITLKATDLGNKPRIKDFQVLVNRPTQEIKISWNYDEKVKEFKLYRAKNEEAMLLYKIIDGKDREFYDKKMSINSKYKYAIKAVFDDYAESAITSPIEVNY